jgi:hypothetical protein
LPLRRRQVRASTPGFGPHLGGPEGLPWTRLLAPAPRGLDMRAVAFGPELPDSGLVPPLPFLPASTVCSARTLAGLLHPAADHGVHHVSGARDFLPAVHRRMDAPEGGPRCEEPTGDAPCIVIPVVLPPSGAFPSPTAAPRHRSRCPLAVRRAPRRAAAFQKKGARTACGDATDLKALIHRRVRCSPPALQPAGCPLLPWASDPLKDRCHRLRVLPAFGGEVTSHRAPFCLEALPGFRPRPEAPGEPDGARLRRAWHTFPFELRSPRQPQPADPTDPPTPKGAAVQLPKKTAMRRGRHFQRADREARICAAPRGARRPHPQGVRLPFPLRANSTASARKPGVDGSGVRPGALHRGARFRERDMGHSTTLPGDTAEAATHEREGGGPTILHQVLFTSKSAPR